MYGLGLYPRDGMGVQRLVGMSMAAIGVKDRKKKKLRSVGSASTPGMIDLPQD